MEGTSTVTSDIASSNRIDLSKPYWDQSTFIGRVKHFFWLTDPRTVLYSTKHLNDAKDLILAYKECREPPGTTSEQVHHARQLYESSFHPDSGELGNVIGRMSFQVPGGMAITGAMLQWYRTNTAVIFWQWVNQSFNALVNYTNRNAQSDVTNKQIAVAYVTATTSAVVTAIGLKQYLAKRASPLMQRFVPFAAVAAANMVNIPLMRQSELKTGIATFSATGEKMTESKYAAGKGIGQVVLSRITIAAPGMMICPVIMQRLERLRWMQKIAPLHGPIQVMIVGCFLIFMVPVGCGLFPQICSIDTRRLKLLDGAQLEQLTARYGDSMPDKLYFNKGL